MLRVLSIVLGLASLPATHLLARLCWQQVRDSRALAALLSSDQHFLRRIVTADLVTSPPPAARSLLSQGGNSTALLAMVGRSDEPETMPPRLLGSALGI